ncbi:hypothetical protein ACFV0T_41565 [Streptomyces sp. NPDC059582]|uniref:hypothetical protein n=1 Tax=Streptomyces sp. NPDC059582 TaxID=3346875 RepID=UPI00367C8ABA
MIKNVRLKSTVVAMVAAGGFLTFAPSASAAGNCTHYGTPGYIQYFSDNNFQGDCYELQEWQVNYNLKYTPAGNMDNRISSLRSWSSYGHSLWSETGDSGQKFTFGANEQWASLPAWINDQASSVG